MPRLSLLLLGPPQLMRMGEALEIQRRKVKALLIFLAVTREPHQREKLATLLWPESSQQRALGSLRRNLSELNSILEDDLLDTNRETVGLAPTADLWLDLNQFHQYLAECQSHDHPPGEVCPACIIPLTGAVALYRDDFLAGFTLPDCPEFDEWQFFQAEALRQTLASALTRLVQAHLQGNNPEAAIPYARRQLSLDPLHEPAHRRLMQLYVQNGQQAAALRQYQICVQTFQEELGIAPSKETILLYERIRTGDLSRGEITPIFQASSAHLIGGRFEIRDFKTDLLGQGGMGRVYRGRDSQSGEAVAIKVLKPEFVIHTPEMVERFNREGQALRQLNHPNIVKLLATVEEEDQHYLVMEYVTGDSLRDLLDRVGQLPLSQVFHVALELCDALSHTHQRNIIHRDIKPANILLDESGTPRLTDFGVAHLALLERVTQTGAALGTLDYLSPEALNGEPVDARTDIWSLGVLLFESLAGQRPFKGQTPVDLLTAILTRPLPDLATLRPDIPVSLVNLVSRMLEKERQVRIPTMRQVGAVLEAIIKDIDLLIAPSVSIHIPSPTTLPTPQHNLPAQTMPFVGRETELAELTRLLGETSARLVSILGPGGMGKTRLALELAARQIEAYSHGVYFVPLAPLRRVEQLVPAIAEAIKFPFQAGENSSQQQLLDHLSQKQMLLVLDNFEHLLDGVGLVQAILEAGPGISLLVTTRERLNLSSETVFTLGSMAFPTWETPKDAEQYSAIELFRQTAQRARPGFELGVSQLQYVARICRLVGGMPLGIVLAAAWVEILTPEEIAAELTQSFDFLETDFRDIPERQRSIRVVFEYSWRRLTEMERAVFMRLSVFRGGFTRQAAQTVTEASLRILAGLVNKSFIQSTVTGRYEIHELLRQYAEAQLEALGQAQAAREAHAAYYLDFLRQSEADLAGRQQLTRLAELEADRENISIAWRRAVEVRDYTSIDQALEGLFRWYWLRRDRQQEGRALLRFAREQWAPAPGQVSQPVWGRILARVLDVEGPWLTEPDRVRGRIENALVIAQNLGNKAETAFCLWTLGFSHMNALLASSDYDKALAYLKQSFTIYQALNDRFYQAQLLQDIGHCYRRTWQVDRALNYLQLSFRLRYEIEDKIGQGHCLRELGWATFLAGNAAETENYWQQACTIRREVGDRQGIADSLITLSLLALTQGDWPQGQRLAEESLKLAQDIGSNLHTGWAVRGLEVAASMAATKQTASSLISLNTLNRFEAILFHLIFSRREERINEKQLQLALKEASHDLDTVRCLPFAAMDLGNRGEPERAVSLLALAYRYPEFATGWMEKLPMVQRFRTNLEATLPPDAFAAAWARGQTLNLEATVAQLLAELAKISTEATVPS